MHPDFRATRRRQATLSVFVQSQQTVMLDTMAGVDRIVNLAAQFLGAFARGGYAPLRPAPDSHPPLPPRMAVVEGEGPVARGLDPSREADHLSVKDLIADARLRLRIAQGFLIQFQSLDQVPCLLAPRHRRRPARLSSQSTGKGAEYRQRPELKWEGQFRSSRSEG